MTDEWPPPTVSVIEGPRKHPIRVCAFGADVMFLTVEEAIALASDLSEAVGQIRNSEPAYPPHRYWQDAEKTVPDGDGDPVGRIDTDVIDRMREQASPEPPAEFWTPRDLPECRWMKCEPGGIRTDKGFFPLEEGQVISDEVMAAIGLSLSHPPVFANGGIMVTAGADPVGRIDGFEIGKIRNSEPETKPQKCFRISAERIRELHANGKTDRYFELVEQAGSLLDDMTAEELVEFERLGKAAGPVS